MAIGYNLAEKRNLAFSSNSNSNGICVFISHVKDDKPLAISVGEYIKKAGYNIYLDIEDDELQKAASASDAAKITACIEKGIEASTHVMCIVSERTVRSWWVPYEIGFSKKCGKGISSLTHKGTSTMPEYLQIGFLIRGIKGLNSYLESIKADVKKFSVSIPGTLTSEYTNNHPLEAYLEKYR